MWTVDGLWTSNSAKVASLGSSRQCLGADDMLGLPPRMQMLQHVCKICVASTYSRLIKVDKINKDRVETIRVHPLGQSS